LEVEFEVEWAALAVHQLLELLHNAWAQDGEDDSGTCSEKDPNGKMGLQRVKEDASHQ
jgi:hypothetical protein